MVGQYKNKVVIVDKDRLRVTLTQGKTTIVKNSLGMRCVLVIHRFCANPTRAGFYATTNVRDDQGRRHIKALHHFIVPRVAGMHVDHIDGDTLNNHDNNLRSVTPRANQLKKKTMTTNTSGVAGVCRNDLLRCWQAKVYPSARVCKTKSFSDGAYGGKDRAFAAACAWREHEISLIPDYVEAKSFHIQ